ncbi:MAG: isoprenyl transferase [Deltaproteobacteria bacterium]|nr:isoprenyl transferase [Deltaproteobacteria bacterium]
MKVPAHVAIIMDGNGRWAEGRGLSRVRGHEEGAESVRAITTACRELGCKALTLYSFSTENWKRPDDEVGALMGLLGRYLVQERREILDNGIRLNAVGQLDRLPMAVRAALKELMHASRDNKGMVLTLALSYGSRHEIVEAARALAKRCASGRLRPDQIDEAAFAAELQTAGLPDPDLLIRTSGELRISNFMLWQLAYAEIYVTDVLWPDFRRPELEAAFAAFGGRERRFGLTGAQLRRAT